MMRKQLNIIRLSLDNLRRRWTIYLLLAGAAGICTAVILFLLLAAEGLRNIAHDNLMLLPLNKLWIKPGPRSGSGTEARITEDLLKTLEQDSGIVRVWPQIDYRLSAFVELQISVVVYREKFDSIVEVYGVHGDLVKDDLFKGRSFSAGENDEEIPVVLPASVVHMLNKKIARMAHLPEGKTFPVGLMQNFKAAVYLENQGRTGGKYVRIPCRPAGVSMNIPQIGVAVPISRVKKWNKEYGGVQGEASFSRVLIETGDPEKAAALARRFEEKGFAIESSRETFEKIQSLFTGLQLTIAVLGILIIFSAGVGLFNGMTLVVFAERDIIGVMRAVGAKKRDIIENLLLQAAAAGTAGGIAGTAAAFGAAFGMEQALVSLITSYGMSAQSLFVLSPLWAAGGILIPALICVIFSLPPVLKAVSVNPSDVL